MKDVCQLVEGNDLRRAVETHVPVAFQLEPKLAAVHFADHVDRRSRAIPAVQRPERGSRSTPAPWDQSRLLQMVERTAFRNEAWNWHAQISQRVAVGAIDLSGSD